MNEQGPKKIKDLFPNVNPERVEQLMQDPNFKALQALMDLQEEIDRMQEMGVDADKIVKLLDVLYLPAYQSFEDSLTNTGWSRIELDAAHNVAMGVLSLS